MSPRTQRERSAATTRGLVEAARALFAEQGYAGTTLDAVARAAGVTKGALYHHFAGKRELFEAVFEDEQRRLADAVGAAAARRRDPWQALAAGCVAFLEESLDEGVRRITLLDGPGVLGLEGMREIEERHGLRLLRRGVAASARAGRLGRADPDSLTELLYGALCHAGLHVARAPDRAAAHRRMVREVRRLLDGLALVTDPR